MTTYAPSTALLRVLASTAFSSARHASAASICQRCALHTSRAVATSSDPFTFEEKKPPGKSDLRTPEMKHRRSRDGELQPKALSRPLGLFHPPKAGQNTGRDTRTFAEKRDDFASYERYKERQTRMLNDVFENNYFKDIGNLGKQYKGKSIIAPSTPFRAELALYFPNLEGTTLEKGSPRRDTAPIMLGRISIISVLNTEWANGQVQSFTSSDANPELRAYLNTAEAKSVSAQLVTINVEQNWLKAMFIRMFWFRLRGIFPREQWSTYFLNRRGITMEIRDALGMWNSKVGYVYLVDGKGRIRWAANGDATEDEKKNMLYCVKRLVTEARGASRSTLATREEPMRTVRDATLESPAAITA